MIDGKLTPVIDWLLLVDLCWYFRCCYLIEWWWLNDWLIFGGVFSDILTDACGWLVVMMIFHWLVIWLIDLWWYALYLIDILIVEWMILIPLIFIVDWLIWLHWYYSVGWGIDTSGCGQVVRGPLGWLGVVDECNYFLCDIFIDDCDIWSDGRLHPVDWWWLVYLLLWLNDNEMLVVDCYFSDDILIDCVYSLVMIFGCLSASIYGWWFDISLWLTVKISHCDWLIVFYMIVNWLVEWYFLLIDLRVDRLWSIWMVICVGWLAFYLIESIPMMIDCCCVGFFHWLVDIVILVVVIFLWLVLLLLWYLMVFWWWCCWWLIW